MYKTQQVILEQDEHGNLVLPLGEKFMTDHSWLVGDHLEWQLVDGCAIVTNTSAKHREAGKIV